MKPFEIVSVREVLLTHTNLRKEFHGDAKVQAIDLNFEIEGSNELLDMIDPVLRTMLYFNRQATAGQLELPEHLQVLPDLRAPKFNNQKFRYGGNDKYKGYLFQHDFGVGGASNLSFHNASAGKFSFETKDGGTVVLGFQVSYSGDELTDVAITRLVRLEGEKVFILLRAPDVLQLVKGGKSASAASEANDDTDDLLTEVKDDEPDDKPDDDKATVNDNVADLDSVRNAFLGNSTPAVKTTIKPKRKLSLQLPKKGS